MISFVILGFLLIGSYCVAWTFKQSRKSQQCKHWPSVQGKILDSRFIEARPQHDESDSLEFFYQYQVNGKNYTGSAINLFELALGLKGEELRQLTEQFPSGHEVTVYFNSEAPQESVLLPLDTRGRSSLLGLGLVCIGAGLLILLVTL